jgi:hypothetical protein
MTLRDQSLDRYGGPAPNRTSLRSLIQAFVAWYYVALRTDSPNAPTDQ